MKHVLFITGVFLVGFLWVPQTMATDRVPVVVSIAPQRYMVQQIGKDLVDVQVMVPSGADLHTYEPKPRQMTSISNARLYFAVGIEFERRWLEKFRKANRKMRVVYTTFGIQKIPMEVQDHPAKRRHYKKTEHVDPAGGRHEKEYGNHGMLDPHIWLSPPLVMMQARTILTALQLADGDHRSEYQDNYKAFMLELMDLDAEFREIFAGKHGLEFMVFHPAWGYFAKAYGLRQVPVEIEGKEPKPAQLAELINYARKRRIKIVFVQPQFSAQSAEQIAKEIGGKVLLADPMAPDWSESLRKVAKRIKVALR